MQFLSMKSTNYCECLISVYEASSCLEAIIKFSPFDTQRIITLKVVFCNSGRVIVTFLRIRCPKSVASRFLRLLPIFLASHISLAHFFQNIPTQCPRIHSAESKFTYSRQLSNVAKKSATAISQWRGLSQTWLKQSCLRMIDPCCFSRNPATHIFFHLFNLPKLACPILFAKCFSQNSVSFRLIGSLPFAPGRSGQSPI